MLELFAQSGLSKADLAKMLGKKPEQITRWLAGPGNMNFDTLSDLVFALNGSYVIVNAKEPQSTVAKVGDKFGKRQSFENEKVLRSETKWLRASPTRSAASKNIIYLNMRKTEPSYERIPERTAS